MEVFWKHGIISVNVNVILNPEKFAALKKWFDFIDPLIPRRLIERIKTNTSETIYPYLLFHLFDDGNYCQYKLILVNNALVDMLHLYLTSKCLC